MYEDFNNNQTSNGIAENALIEHIEGISKGLRDLKEEITTKYTQSVFDDEEKTEKIKKELAKKESLLKSMFNSISQIKDDLADNIVVVGKLMHSEKKNDAFTEKTTKKLIEEIDVELTEEDFDPVAIISFLTNENVVSTSPDSLSLAEANLLIAKKLEPVSSSAAKIALLQNAAIPLIIQKNCKKSPDFAKAYANRHNLNINEKSLISLLEKMDKYHLAKKKNEALLTTICAISGHKLSDENIDSALENIKEVILKKAYTSMSLDSTSFSLSTEDYQSIPAPQDSKSKIFIDFAQFYLKLNLPDPTHSLQNEVDKKVCNQNNHITTPKEEQSTLGAAKAYNKANHIKL